MGDQVKNKCKNCQHWTRERPANLDNKVNELDAFDDFRYCAIMAERYDASTGKMVNVAVSAAWSTCLHFTDKKE